MSPENTDRIADKARLYAPRPRVWRALADSGEFGQWFGVKGFSPFAPGATARGKLTHEGYEHVTIEITIERMEPERLFSFRWHPYAVKADVDYSGEPKTLVVFELEKAPDGTILSVVESGFDRLPAGRREEAYRMHKEGWAGQMESIKQYLVKAA